MNKVICLFFIFGMFFSSFAESPSDVFKEAMKFESEGKLYDAISSYKKYLTFGNSIDKEKVKLKIARLTQDFGKKIDEYERFIMENSESKYIYTALYEMASIYMLKDNLDRALEYFRKLSFVGENTPYHQKALLQISRINLKKENYSETVKVLYQLLENIDDYYDTGESYFLLGMAMLKQGLKEDAEEYFLITAGSYSESSKASTSLKKLADIYEKTGRKEEALKAAMLIKEKYADTFEGRNIKDTISRLKKEVKTKELPDLQLINLNFDPDLKNKVTEKIRDTLKESNIDVSELVSKAKEFVSGVYLQFGYYSSKGMAEEILNKYEDKGIDGLFVKEESKDDKHYYRLVKGPYDSRGQASDESKKFKSKSIDSIIKEFTANYE